MIRLAIFSVLVLLCQGQSFAGIFLPAISSPDILSGFLGSTFDSVTKEFKVNGQSRKYNGLNINGHSSATTKIDAIVGGSLGLDLYEATGTIEIRGRSTPGDSSSAIATLLTGSLRGIKAGFNYAGTTDSFEFHFYVTGGLFGSQFGKTARTMMFLNGSNTASDFSNNFFHTASVNNSADTNPTVPESSSAVVWLALGCVTMIASSRRRFFFQTSTSFA
jgi:hypothetical protein